MANEPETPPTETPSPPPVGAPAREPATPTGREAPSTVINFNNPLAQLAPKAEGENGGGPSPEHPGRSAPKGTPAKAAGKAAEGTAEAAEEAGEWVERTVLEVPPWVTVAVLVTAAVCVGAFVLYQRSKQLERQANAPEQAEPADNTDGQGVVNLQKPSFLD
jgi:hypothetical protein